MPRRRLPRPALLAAIVAVALAVPRPARAVDDDPRAGKLLLAGAGMAIPTYLGGVAVHEGTHALLAHAFGADVTEVRLYPGIVDGHFYFGYTRWRGKLAPGELAFTLLAPKLVDLLFLGGYAALLYTGSLPDNDYAALALTVWATGSWVDFAKDIVSWNPTNDLMKVHRIYGRTREAQRWPWRLLHLGIAAGAAFVLAQGYADIFEDEPATVVVGLGTWSF